MSANEEVSLGCNDSSDTEIIYVIATEEDDTEALAGDIGEGTNKHEEACKDIPKENTELDPNKKEQHVPTKSSINETMDTEITKLQYDNTSMEWIPEHLHSNFSQNNTTLTSEQKSKRISKRKQSLPSKAIDESESLRRSSRIHSCTITSSTKSQKNQIANKDNLNTETNNISILKKSKDNTNNSLEVVYNKPTEESSETQRVEEVPIEFDWDHYSTVNLSNREALLEDNKKPQEELYTKDTGPTFYNVKGPLATQPIITKNLPEVFNRMPIFGKPLPGMELKTFYQKKIREFVGCDLNDNEFDKLETYCSADNLRTGKEMQMRTSVPVMGLLSANICYTNDQEDIQQVVEEPNLCIVKKNKLKLEKGTKGLFPNKLKYRGARMLPFSQEANPESSSQSLEEDVDLEPGKDIIYRVRMYRPYFYNHAKDRHTRSRHSVFSCDALFAGRQRLSALRDRFVCSNDYDVRVDVAHTPDHLPSTKAREVFPSGFLLINNVFYVDSRAGCADRSATLRAWARARGVGDFRKQDMAHYRFQDLVLKLGYPDVYVHQGNCEHVFIFSEIRLLNASDPLRLAQYPCSTAIAQNQTVYCTTCAEFCAKWIVTGCARVPFDPAFFCDTCFRQYLYVDGKKICDFKAYAYRGNAINVLKPL